MSPKVREGAGAAFYGDAHLAFRCGLLRTHSKLLGFLERAAESRERVLESTDLPSRVFTLAGANNSIQLFRPEEQRKGVLRGKLYYRNDWFERRGHVFGRTACLPHDCF